jgi:hypothetical protein
VGLIAVWIRSTDSPIVTLLTLISLPVLAGLLGFCATALGCALYNQLSSWMGGISLDLAGDATGRPGAAEEVNGNQGGKIQQEGQVNGQPRVKSFSVCRVRPNPAGKEHQRDGSPPAELVCGEWIDIRNHGMSAVTTKGVCLYHLAYPGPGGAPECRLVASLPDRWLKPGEVLRVHSGQRRDLSALRPEDRTGADWHSFAGENAFNYNNREGDTLILYEVATETAIDTASYDPNPPEDAILLRQGSKLIPAQVAAASRW